MFTFQLSENGSPRGNAKPYEQVAVAGELPNLKSCAWAGKVRGSLSRRCLICASPDRARIEAERESGASYREIGALFNVSKFSVQRHFQHKAAADTTPMDELELSEKRLATLSLRLEEQYVAALAIADSKVALDIVKALARLESERHNRIVKRKQAEEDAGGDPGSPTYGAPKPEWLDKIVNAVRARETAELAKGQIVCPACQGLKIVDPSRIAERLPDIQAAVQTYEKSRVNDDCSPTNWNN
jgi:hypothetical protein